MSNLATRRPVSGIPRRLPDEIERGASRLQNDQTGTQVTALIAPTGYGKTVLLSQWARAYPGPVIWLTLTEGAADPEHLAAELTRACERLDGFLGEQSRQSSPAPLGVLVRATALARDLDALTGNVMLVIDQTELLSAAAAEWLGRFLSQLGEGHRACVAGFDLAPLRLGRLLAQGQVTVLGTPVLAFTSAERRAFLDARGASGTPDTDEHWPLGLALGTAGQRFSALTPQAWLGEMLAALPETYSELLDVAAVLEEWSTDHFRALGTEPPPHWSSHLFGCGLPLHSLGEGLFRPHASLRKALQERLACSPDRQRTVCLQAAARAEQRQSPLEAIRLYTLAGSLPRSLDVAERYACALEERWQFGLLRQVLESFDFHTLPPPLRVKLGLCLLHFGEVVRAEQLLRELQQLPAVRAEALFLLSALASRRGDSQRQLELAQAGLASQPCERVNIRLLRVQASALNVLGQASKALVVIQEALDLADSCAQPGERAHLLTLLNAVHAFTRPPLKEREVVIRAGIRAYQTAGLPQGCTRLHASLAYLYRLQGRFQESWDEISAGLRREEQHPTPDLCLMLEAQGDLQLWSGRPEEARAAYQQSLQAAEGQGMTFLQVGLHHKLGECALIDNDGSGVQRHLSQARSWQYEQKAGWLAGEGHFFEGLFAVSQGSPQQARSAFLAALDDPQLSLEREARTRAHLLHLHGQSALPEADVDALCSHLAYLGSSAVLRLDLPALAPLYARLARIRPDAGFTGLLVGAEDQPAELAPQDVALHVQLLGGFQVTIAGRPVRIPNSKSAELLAWLALHGPSDRDVLVDALTGGDAEQRHIEYVKVSVRRLRAALMEASEVSFNPLEFLDGQYSLSRRFNLTVDVTALQQGRETTVLGELQTVLKAYAGPFLPKVQSEWAEEVRLKLAEDVLELAYRTATLARKSEPKIAMQTYRWILELDPLQEAAARDLVDLVNACEGAQESIQLQRHCQRRLMHELRS